MNFLKGVLIGCFGCAAGFAFMIFSLWFAATTGYSAWIPAATLFVAAGVSFTFWGIVELIWQWCQNEG
jgi:hypothetical protein